MIAMYELQVEHIQPGLLFDFSDARLLETFIQLNAAARQNIIILPRLLPVDYQQGIVLDDDRGCPVSHTINRQAEINRGAIERKIFTRAILHHKHSILVCFRSIGFGNSQ